MKITTSLATAVAVVTMMGSSLCQAQSAPDKKQKQFEKLDADKSGSLSLQEYTSKVNTPQRAEQFTARDTDKNGALTLQEFSTPPGKKGKEQPAAE